MITTRELDQNVIQRGLCTNCGACQGLCPYWQSRNGRTTHFFECERTDGRCLRFCPRMPTDIPALQKQFFAAEQITPLGPLRSAYLCRAADAQIREKSQHGGATTALLKLALQEGLIDAAVLTRTDHCRQAEGFLATSEEEILQCSGAGFQSPPSLRTLNEAIQSGKFSSIGLVGTPCKTLATHKIMSTMNFRGVPHGIGLVIGLFCGWALDWQGYEQLLDDANAQHVDILPSAYHAMRLQNGAQSRDISLDEVLPLVRQNCSYCTDFTAEFADISVGGGRSNAGWQQDKGWNQLLVRSARGEELVQLAISRGVLQAQPQEQAFLHKLEQAAVSKKRKGVANLRRLTQNAEDLAYLNPSAAAFADLEA